MSAFCLCISSSFSFLILSTFIPTTFSTVSFSSITLCSLRISFSNLSILSPASFRKVSRSLLLMDSSLPASSEVSTILLSSLSVSFLLRVSIWDWRSALSLAWSDFRVSYSYNLRRCFSDSTRASCRSLASRSFSASRLLFCLSTRSYLISKSSALRSRMRALLSQSCSAPKSFSSRLIFRMQKFTSYFVGDSESMRLSISAYRAMRSFWGLNDIINIIIMDAATDSLHLSEYQTVDQFHSFSEYRSLEERQNPNDKSVSHIEQSEKSLMDEIECLDFNDKPLPIVIQKNQNLGELAQHQSDLQERFTKFGRFLSQNRQNQNTIGRELGQFKVAIAKRCEKISQEVLEQELGRAKEVLEEHQKRIEELAKGIKGSQQGGKIVKEAAKNAITRNPYTSNPFSITTYNIDQPQNYNSQPHLLTFKLCCLVKDSRMHYSNNQINVKYTKSEDGIVLELQGNQDFRLFVNNIKSTKIKIPWERFGKGRFVQHCEIIDPKGNAVTVPIPLPLNFIFQKRLGSYHRGAKYLKLRDLMVSSQIVIKHYDRKVWNTLLHNPTLFHFDKQPSSSATLRHAINLVNHPDLFLTEISLINSSLHILISHKPNSPFLSDLLEFYSFLMCQ